MSKRKFFIDTDTASDDAVALLIHKGYQIDQTIVGSLIHNCFC